VPLSRPGVTRGASPAGYPAGYSEYAKNGR
jgi:hypothetical protein